VPKTVITRREKKLFSFISLQTFCQNRGKEKFAKASMNFNVPTVNMSLKDNYNHSSCYSYEFRGKHRIVGRSRQKKQDKTSF
jgi:hypothetical protein